MYEQNIIEELILGCERHDPKSQEMLYRTFFGFSMSVCLRYSKTEEDALEILNSSFLKVFNRIQQLDKPKAFKSWLKSILIRCAIDHIRKTKNYEQAIERSDHIDLEWTMDNEGELSHEEILAEVQALPDSYRIVFNMYEIEGYSHREISVQLRISESTSRSHLAEAKKRLRKKLKRRLHLPAFLFVPFGYSNLTEAIRSSLLSIDPSYQADGWMKLQNSYEIRNEVDSREEVSILPVQAGYNSIAAHVVLTLLVGSILTLFFLLPENSKTDNVLPANAFLWPAAFEIKGSVVKLEKPKGQKVLSKENVDTRQNLTNSHVLNTKLPTKYIEKMDANVRVDAIPYGGYKKLDSFIEENFIYPDELRKDSITGRVTVNFDIDKRGEISNVAVVKGLHRLIDKEVVKVIQKMPSWQPTYINCKPIKANYSIPIKVEM